MIRYTVLISIWILALIPTVKGQSAWSMGLKAGVSLSNQSVIFRLPGSDYQMETSPVTGPTASLFMEYSRWQHWGIQLDAGYIPKGSSTSTESISVLHLEEDRIVENRGVRTTSDFRYLSLTAAVRYRILSGSFSPYLVAGSRVDILMDYQTGSEYPLEDQNSFIPGLTLGGGAEFIPGRMGIFVEALFQGDIIPVTGTDPMLINNHTGLFTLGLRYRM